MEASATQKTELTWTQKVLPDDRRMRLPGPSGETRMEGLPPLLRLQMSHTRHRGGLPPRLQQETGLPEVRIRARSAMTMADNIFGFLIVIAVFLISIYTIYLSTLMKRKIDRRERARES